MAFSNLQHYDKFQEINVEQLNSDLTSSPVSLMGGGCSNGFSESVFIAEAPTETPPKKEVGVTEGIPRGKVKAARPRGGGIEDEDEGRKSRHDYRRASPFLFVSLSPFLSNLITRILRLLRHNLTP
jgi:hypothetical protein